MEESSSAFVRILVATLVGLLIGLDRERTAARKTRRPFAGVRTFPLIALAGAVPMILLPRVGGLLLLASFLAVAGVALISYLRTSGGGDVGATTEMAAIATFWLGSLAGGGQIVTAGATGVAVAVLLVAKPRLEGFSRNLSREELAAALELAVISIIVLPLVPNRGMGPWEVLNPFEIWMVVVLVNGLSFVGFVAMRIFGPGHGRILSGAVGGLVSSTAVTVALAREPKRSASAGALAAASAVVASSIMSVRVAFLAGLIDVGILPRLLPVVLVMSAEGVLAAVILKRRAGGTVDSAAPPRMTNPSSLPTAIGFSAVYACVLIIVRFAREFLGPSGTYLAAILSSIADVDAATIAFTSLGHDHGNWQVPVAAVSIALVTNTLFKIGIVVVLGQGSFRRQVTLALSVMAALGAVSGFLVTQLG